MENVEALEAAGAPHRVCPRDISGSSGEGLPVRGQGVGRPAYNIHALSNEPIDLGRPDHPFAATTDDGNAQGLVHDGLVRWIDSCHKSILVSRGMRLMCQVWFPRARVTMIPWKTGSYRVMRTGTGQTAANEGDRIPRQLEAIVSVGVAGLLDL